MPLTLVAFLSAMASHAVGAGEPTAAEQLVQKARAIERQFRQIDVDESTAQTSALELGAAASEFLRENLKQDGVDRKFIIERLAAAEAVAFNGQSLAPEMIHTYRYAIHEALLEHANDICDTAAAKSPEQMKAKVAKPALISAALLGTCLSASAFFIISGSVAQAGYEPLFLRILALSAAGGYFTSVPMYYLLQWIGLRVEADKLPEALNQVRLIQQSFNYDCDRLLTDGVSTPKLPQIAQPHVLVEWRAK